MEKHLIFMDIDGTLVNNEQQISEKTQNQSSPRCSVTVINSM
jgi:hydroxymethylpyrimidine pyrophosphatase-like HAD family hydrolase